MMQYDVAIIGSGVAGLTAGLRSIEAGLKTIMISQGQSALHFSSGSIDVLSQTPNKQQVSDPFAAIDHFTRNFPSHPYAKLGQQKVRSALNWYQDTLEKYGIPMCKQQNNHNHQRITPMGTLKTTWLSQPFVEQITENVPTYDNIIMLAIDGYRDFQPQIALDNLTKHPKFAGIPIKKVSVCINAFDTTYRSCNELRSIDLSRILQDEQEFNHFSDQLMKLTTPNDLVIMPAVLGEDMSLMNKLHQSTRLRFHEVPTMPPSLLGIRMEEALSHAFIRQGGTLLKGDQVLSGQFEQLNNTLTLRSIMTRNMSDIPIRAQHFILASGSFFSKGLIADRKTVTEPIFNLDTVQLATRAQWRDDQFFTLDHHPFMGFGVDTDAQFRPMIDAQIIDNMFCAGSILAHYNPVVEGCGSGVAISSAYDAIAQIVSQQTLPSTDSRSLATETLS